MYVDANILVPTKCFWRLRNGNSAPSRSPLLVIYPPNVEDGGSNIDAIAPCSDDECEEPL
jgi:hypothetical protein